MRRFHFVAPLLAALALTFACKKSETTAPPPAAPPPAAAPAPAPAPTPFSVKGVTLGNAIGADKRVTTPQAVFAPTDTIYAVAETAGASPSVTLVARWTYEDGQLVSEATEVIAPNGPAATEFHISKPDGWPTGKYKVEISANGSPAGSQEFEVR